MSFTNGVPRIAVAAILGLAILALVAGSAFAGPGEQRNVLGPEDQSKTISMTVWLNLRNKATLDAMVKDMYDRNSANFHHFLTREQYKAQFAPADEDAATLRAFLEEHNMKVTFADKNNHFIQIQGRVGDAQEAFHTQINRILVKGEVHRAAASAPSVSGRAGTLIAAVQGLSDLGYQSHVSRAIDPDTRIPFAGVPTTAAGPDGLFFSGQCLRPPETVIFTTGGTFPTAHYFGNRYGQNITSTAPNLPPCGYDPAELQGAYNLGPLYLEGLNGAEQTIMIVDGFGSNTILADANEFNTLNGLPQLVTSGPNANFAIFTPNGSATCTATNGCIAGNWQFETTLDVEWAHSIAPGANIVLILGADNSFTNLDIANLFGIENQFGNVLSNSFGIPEIVLVDLDPPELVVENGISEIAAALGINQDISTGDDGDNLAVDNADFGIDSVSPGANADSPFATGIGGTSTFLTPGNTILFETGWGLNETRIANPAPNPPTVPPLDLGFIFGAGGGVSTVYAKPAYQKKLRGNFRLQPDISMNADPETGVEIVVTPDSVPGDEQEVAVFGGTSLSCPMFSALWAIANQAAGGGPIGQAAPILYELPPIAIRDVVPVGSPADVIGVILNPPAAPTIETPADLAQPLENTTTFVSALFNSAISTRWDVFTFGTDTSLTVTPGWDDVTGLGTPNGGENFINAVVAAVK